ncbi:VOC family protein [Candidatus Curtissbacteria bacterium]|nr:VOC family protein [Candidatus Curtissbacteria bacterium]
MKISAVGVASSDMKKTAEFYGILGFDFSNADLTQDHVEPVTPEGSTRLMIDSNQMIKDIFGEEPVQGNHSTFAIEYSTVEELNNVADKLTRAGYVFKKEPWDAFWGQRYAIIADPGGCLVDLYARL